MPGVLHKLEGGDRRSTGRVDEVVAEVLADPSLFGGLFCGMLDGDPVIRMRAADAVEKITAENAALLVPYKAVLIREVAHSRQQEVRWHVAQLIPRLELSAQERQEVVGILLGYLEDQSRIVKTFSMQALADLARTDEELRARVLPLLEELAATGSPAMRSRGTKLVAQLVSQKPG
jgi:hypothetical protein